jgi:uncharacterized protein (TIGR00297 family)
MPESYPVYAVLIIGVVLSIIARKLTVAGAVTGGFVGLLAYQGAGYMGIGMLALFFLTATAATSWQMLKKQQIGAGENNNGRRTAGQVIANGGVAALLGGTAWHLPQYAVIIQLMMAGSLAAATADTLSSELGTLYGRRFYNIATFKKDLRGLDGVISVEGTLIGTAGAFLIAFGYALSFGWSNNILWIVIAGTTGNLADSVMGATLERKNRIGNNIVNFLNTLIGAMVCLLLANLTGEL